MENVYNFPHKVYPMAKSVTSYYRNYLFYIQYITFLCMFYDVTVTVHPIDSS